VQIPGVATQLVFSWPCQVSARPSAGNALAEWLDVIAAAEGRTRRSSSASLHPQIIAALQQDVRGLLTDKYDEYMEAGGHSRKTANTGCMILVIALLTVAAAVSGLAWLACHMLT
jgi:hypothetical protein